jgi:hypothetical protein
MEVSRIVEASKDAHIVGASEDVRAWCRTGSAVQTMGVEHHLKF